MSATAEERDAEPSTSGPDLKLFLLVLRRALLLIVAYIEGACGIEGRRRG